jgi:3-phenylpropionate/trans-cinnamate dioxygenase ferredoxin reductase subunit
MTSKICKIDVNGENFSGYCGDLLLDAALMNGVNIPHDCRSGYCGTCRVRVISGRSFGGKSSDPEYVQACQCRIVSDLKVEVEDVPEIVTISGRVAELTRLAPDVVEVGIEPSEPLSFIPGQYCSVQFRGYPARCFSPTAPLAWPCDTSLLRFHIRQVRNGRVSTQLGTKIDLGHRVKVTGPFGTAFLRPFRSKRLVMVASGTGFAPIWSVAEAAIKEQPLREMVLLVAGKTLDSLYMTKALCRLALFPNVTIIPTVSMHQTVSKVVRQGRPTDYLPTLSHRDVVFAAGAPAMVEAVAEIAQAAGAKCYADPFEPHASRTAGEGFLSRAAGWLSGKAAAEVTSPPLSMADWQPPAAQERDEAWRHSPPIAPQRVRGSDMLAHRR